MFVNMHYNLLCVYMLCLNILIYRMWASWLHSNPVYIHDNIYEVFLFSKLSVLSCCDRKPTWLPMNVRRLRFLYLI